MIPTDTVAVVTGGAGENLGGELCRQLSAAGARVVVADINEEWAQQTADEVGGHAVKVDLTDEESISDAVAKVRADVGPIGILVNNAGGVPGGPGDFLTVAKSNVTAAFELNLGGTFVMTQAVAKQMVADEVGGAIVNISSAGALRPAPGWSHYVASKAAINSLTASTALELAPVGIRVNAIAAGPILPAGVDFSGMPSKYSPMPVANIPLGRYAEPGDVASVVVFLAGDGARYVTGVVVPVDGGWLVK